MIDVTMLGNSALLPLPDRALTSVFLTCGGHSILFDCGEGTQTAARRAGVSFVNTDIIALTHYHGDHIFGLPGMLQTMNTMGRTSALTIIGPKGIARELEPILKLTGNLPYELHLLELPNEGIELEKISKGWPHGAYLMPVKTVHRVISQGYVFLLPRAGKFDPFRARNLEIPVQFWSVLQKGVSVFVNGQEFLPEMVLGAPRNGLKVVISGDTCACSSLERAAENADLLISEATYGENEQADLALDHGHMNFEQAAKIGASSRVKRLWLTHFSQMIKDPEDYLPNAHAYFPNAECGFDGKRISLQFEP